MLFKSQITYLGGAGIFKFDATVGTGAGIVKVKMSYEFDSSGIFNEEIESIHTASGYQIDDYLEDETLAELCILGCKLLNDSKNEVY